MNRRVRAGHLLAGGGTCLVALGLGFSLPLMHAGFAVALAGALLARLPFRRTPGLYPLLLGVAWALGTGVLPGLVARGWAGATSRVEGAWWAWLIMPVAAGITADPRWRRRVVLCLAVAVAVGSLLGVVQFVVGHDKALRPFRVSAIAPFGARCSGFFGHHLTQGFVTAAALLTLLQHDRHWGQPRILGWAARGAIALGLMATQARAAIGGLVLGLVAAAGLRSRRRLLAVGGIVLAVGVAGVVGVKLVKPELVDRLGEHQRTRTYIWTVACRAIAGHPLAGTGGKAGFKAFYREHLLVDHPEVFTPFDPSHPEASLERHPEATRHEPFMSALADFRSRSVPPPGSRGRPGWERQRADLVESFGHLSGKAAWFPGGAPHAHSSLLTLAAFYGLPCALLSLAAMLAIVRAGWRRRRECPQGAALAIGLVVFAFTAGLFEYTIGDSESVYALFLCLGLAFGLAGGPVATPAPAEEPQSGSIE